MRIRRKSEIIDYMKDSLQKGDVVIHKLKPKGSRRLKTVYHVKVD